MIARLRPRGFMVVLALMFALVLGAGFTAVAQAASEDVAMFYDDLSQYGQWVEYEKYGAVWKPSEVPEDWRPYTNGRWVPTDDGNVFETEEPWGWATYHYGNWMPTEANGWVWVPGRTWYPSTVEWRTSPESEPVDSSYVGWAPTPPPDYVPPPSFAPPSYAEGSPVTDALIAPLWIFAKAASFLLGFGEPYTPAYSYVNSGVLVPPAYVPVFYPQTVILPAYAAPNYYPPDFIGARRLGVGYYNMGPRVSYLSRVSRIDRAVITRNMNNYSTHIHRIHNMVPPPRVLNRYKYVRQIVPPALAQGRRLPPPRRVSNARSAQAHLNRPNITPRPRQVPRVQGHIPRAQASVRPRGRELPGTALPSRATMRMTPKMRQQVRRLPSRERFVPGRAQPFKPVAATSREPGKAQPGRRTGPAPTGQFQPGTQGRPEQVRPGQAKPGTQRRPEQVRPGQVQPGTRTRTEGPPSRRTQPGEFRPGTSRQGATTPGARKPSGAPLPPGYHGKTPEQRRQLEREHQRQQRGVAPGHTRQSQQQLQQRQRQPQQTQQRQRQQMQQRQQQQQRQRQQMQQRQRQQQQQRQRQQQMQQRQRQQQLQQQRQRQQQMQQRQRQQQLQQQRQRQQQMQQRQRQQQQMQQRQRQQQQIQQRQRQQQLQQQQQRQRQKPKKQEEHR